MIHKIKYFLFVILLLNITFAFAEIAEDDFDGVWAGIEIGGADKELNLLIRNIVPIKKGDTFLSSDPKMKQWCESIKERIPNKEVKYSFLKYSTGEVYFVVGIDGQEIKKTFRDIPASKKNSIQLESDIDKLFDTFDKLNWSLFVQGIFPLENFKKGYITYDIPELNEFVEPLAKLVKAHNQHLLDVIEHSTDPELRAKAATLLSWSQTPQNVEYVIEHDLLRDPDESVRNDLTRSLLFFLPAINDQLVLSKAILCFCNQAKSISMTDRNKALAAIEIIVRRYPKLTEVLDRECNENLKNITQTSILPNVGGFAEKILKIKWKFNNEKYTYLNR